ncbi:hypothetical protein HGRIS_001378 [Hohenbuehelia grisea]|uniref:Uncharacterized protein n=1 Tax=Hohenbuehelia grisea TaxID=104357 RepID=A0ABR3JPR2_9AGAR
MNSTWVLRALLGERQSCDVVCVDGIERVRTAARAPCEDEWGDGAFCTPAPASSASASGTGPAESAPAPPSARPVSQSVPPAGGAPTVSPTTNTPKTTWASLFAASHG